MECREAVRVVTGKKTMSGGMLLLWKVLVVEKRTGWLGGSAYGDGKSGGWAEGRCTILEEIEINKKSAL